MRVFINHLVCEGCGDCSVQSNCVSIEPLETPLGRKRAINQSTCNKDYSCLKGFCPSFVTIDGRPAAQARCRPAATSIPRPCQRRMRGSIWSAPTTSRSPGSAAPAC